MKVIHSSIARVSQEMDSMHMNALSVCLNALFHIYRIKCLLLMQCLIRDLETILPGCEPHSRGILCFGILLWFLILLKDFFCVYTVFQGEMQDAGVELW